MNEKIVRNNEESKMEEFKLEFVRKNFSLPPHEIKQKLGEYCRDITNEEIERLILKVAKMENEKEQRGKPVDNMEKDEEER